MGHGARQSKNAVRMPYFFERIENGGAAPYLVILEKRRIWNSSKEKFGCWEMILIQIL